MDNYFYSGPIDWRDFLSQLDRECAAARMRNVILAWVIGIFYLVIGQSCWLVWMSHCSPVEQAVRGLAMLVAGPALLGMAGCGSRLLGFWPRCPACGKRIYKPSPTIQTKRCPHCHAVILSDSRTLSRGYELPPMVTVPTTGDKRFAVTTYNSEFLQGVRTVGSAVLLMPLFFLFFGMKGGEGLEPMTEKMVLLMGGAMLCISGVAPLIPLSWPIGILKLLRLWPKGQSMFCPECGNMPVPSEVRLSGCCSECGAKLLELIPEPDTPEMLDRQKFKRYWMWNIRVGMILAILTFPLLIMMKAAVLWWWPLLSVGVIWLFYFVILIKRKREAQIPETCPNCTRGLSQAMWSLLYYGRCPNCTRKLVRDENDGKGGDA